MPDLTPTAFTLPCPADHEPTEPLPLLADPTRYVACKWALDTHPKRCAYWLNLFRNHFPKLIDEARREAQDAGRDLNDFEQRAAAARAEFEAYLDHLTQQPGAFGRLTILDICCQRERVLRHHGFDDPYRLAKHLENQQALTVLPKVLDEIDALQGGDRHTALIEGIFAGNIFDLGATRTMDMFTDERVNFHETRGLLKPRPWYRDGLDAWLTRMAGPAHRAAVLFVDNAGPDVVLGMLPFARELLRRGTRVILTANSHPSLNDVTHDELGELLESIAGMDKVIADALTDGRLRRVPSGCWTPLIDLSKVSPALAAAARDEPIDLVVLEGMGRSIESNLDARLTCDCLKIAMVKDQGVADTLGEEFSPCELFDLVMNFEPSGQ